MSPHICLNKCFSIIRDLTNLLDKTDESVRIVYSLMNWTHSPVGSNDYGMRWKTDPLKKWLEIVIRRNNDVIKVSALGHNMFGDDYVTLVVDEDKQFPGGRDKGNSWMWAKTPFAGNANIDTCEAHAKPSFGQCGIIHRTCSRGFACESPECVCIYEWRHDNLHAELECKCGANHCTLPMHGRQDSSCALVGVQRGHQV